MHVMEYKLPDPSGNLFSSTYKFSLELPPGAKFIGVSYEPAIVDTPYGPKDQGHFSACFLVNNIDVTEKRYFYFVGVGQDLDIDHEENDPRYKYTPHGLARRAHEIFSLIEMEYC